MKSTKAISSDLQIPGFPEVVHLKQYDANTRYITIPITDGGSSFTFPDNPVFMIGARLPDGSKVLYDKIINASAPIGVLVSVDPVKWTAQGITGATFTKTASGWSKDGSAVDLDDFGISITKGTPATGSNIVVSSENAVNVLSSGIEIGLAPSLSMIAGNGLIELYIGTNDELISSYCAELQIHEAAADPYSAFTSQSVCTIIAQIQAFVNAELTAHPEWTTTVQDGSIGREKLTQDLVKELDNKANNDGSYDDMTVGNAKQVLGTVGVEDQTPYGFRTAGGTVDIGDRENVKAIVGGTIAWNQQMREMSSTYYIADGSSTVSISDGVATVTPSALYGGIMARSNNLPTNIDGHKMLAVASVLSESMNPIITLNGMSTSPSGFTPSQNWQTIYILINADATKNRMFRVRVNDNSNFSAIYVKNCMAFDLTAMFGSTIADYIYSLEQATVGAGVAWFRKLFPKNYYAYNAGELMSVRTNLHRMVGFNAYNPTTGTAKLVGGNQYQITGAYTALSLDGTTIMPDENGKFTPSASGTLTVTGGNSATTCVHLVWSGYRNGEYEPYEEHEYVLDRTLELRGILRLDANNNLYYDGDTYEADGTVTRMYNVVDLGTLTWSKYSVTQGTLFRSNEIVGAKIITESALQNIICSKYVTVVTGRRAEMTISCSVANKVDIIDSTYADSTAEQFKAAMSGINLVYELATQTTETAEQYQETQVVNDFGTEEYVDYAVEQGLRDVAIPVGSITEYLPNLRDKLQNAPNNPPGSGLWVVQRIDGANVYIPLATALQMINNGEDPTEEVEA